MKSITISNRFSFDRVWLLTVRFFEINKRSWTLGYIGVAGGILSLQLLMGIYGHAASISLTMMMHGFALHVAYPIAGLLLTTSIFKELQSTDTTPQLLLLPATNVEKLFSSWIMSYLAYSIFAISTVLGLILIEGFLSDLFQYRTINGTVEVEGSMTPTFSSYASAIFYYFFYNSIFLLGAVWFRKYNFLKTALTIILFFIVSIFFINFLTITTGSQLMFFQTLTGEGHVADYGGSVMRLLLAFLFLFFAYKRLKNRQIT